MTTATRPRVLLLEDDEDQRSVWRSLLSVWGYDVLAAASPVEAITLAARESIDVAVLDRSMSFNDAENNEGLEVARKVVTMKGGPNRFPVIMLTAYMPDASQLAWWMASAGGGIFDFISKKAARSRDSSGHPQLLSCLRAAVQTVEANTARTARSLQTPGDSSKEPGPESQPPSSLESASVADPSGQRLIEALERWVKLHPRPDEPALAFTDSTYTPREILQAVTSRNEFGLALIEFLQESSSRFNVPPEQFIERAIVANNRG